MSVAFKAVKLVEEFADEVQAPSNDLVESKPQPERYNLAIALRVVRTMETSAGRSAVFEEIKEKNAVFRIVDALYTALGSKVLQPLVLLAYMLKCVVSLGPFDRSDAEAVSMSTFDNEHKTIERVTALAPDVRILRVTANRRNMFSPAQISGALRMLGATPRIWSFLRRLARTHSFMPAARIASALAFYMRFSKLFADQPQLNAAIVASNYSPEAVGMGAAAHKAGKRLVYSNHAPVPANGAFVPPVLADCGMFYGEVVEKTYQRRSRCNAEIGLIGQPATARPMEWREQVQTVGIFLTAGTKLDVLRSLVATIRVDLPEARIIIRQHPVLLLKTDFSTIGIDDPNTDLTIGNPLDDEIAACDLVICGNSGVSMNVLSGGRPVAYLASLDGLVFDANGFVESRLVYSMPWWSEDIYDRLKGFYNAPGWSGVMRSYDASYDADIAAMKREASAVLLRHLRPSAPASRSAAVAA